MLSLPTVENPVPCSSSTVNLRRSAAAFNTHQHRYRRTFTTVNTHLLTIVDRFTRWPEAIPLNDTSTGSCARAWITNWISRFGLPSDIFPTEASNLQLNSGPPPLNFWALNYIMPQPTTHKLMEWLNTSMDI